MRRRGSVRVGLLAAALALTGCSSEDAEQAAIPSAGSAPTSQATDEQSADPWTGFETGPPPRIPYLDGDLYIDPRGSDVEITLPHDHPVVGVVTIGERLLVTDGAFFEGANALHWVDGRSSRQIRSCVSGSPAVSASGGRVAWLTYACPETGLRYPPPALHVADADSGQVTRLRVTREAGHLAAVVGFAGGRPVYQARGAWSVEPDGSSRRIPRVTHVAAVRDKLLAARISDRRDAVTTLRGERRWTTTYPLHSFSPDGTTVLSSGRRGAPVILSTADGSVVTEFDLPRWLSTTEGLVWETDDSLLMVRTKAKRSHVVRLNLDGTVELATPARRLRVNHPGYVVPEPG